MDLFFLFLQGFLCSSVGKSPQNVEKIARFPGGEKSAESCHACGCHGFFGPNFGVSGIRASVGGPADRQFCVVCKHLGGKPSRSS